MATTVFRGGFELEIEDGQIYIAVGDQRQPIVLTELVVESRQTGRSDLITGTADAHFAFTGAPEPRRRDAPVFVPNEGGRRLRVRDDGNQEEKPCPTK